MPKVISREKKVAPRLPLGRELEAERRSGLQSKKTAVVGLGREGLELVRFLRKEGAEVTVLDAAGVKDLGERYREAKRLGAEFRLGENYLENLTDFQMVFRSPGVSLAQKEFKRAVRAGVELTSTTRLFFELCPAEIVGVTGTKGKSTTTSLIFHLLKRGRRRVFMAGNIGESPLHLLKRLRPTDIVVLELSSFQLEDMKTSPAIAVLLNVVPEHLDRHKTFKKYLAAKQNIYLHQTKSSWLVTSRDFPATRLAARQAKGRVFPYSVNQVLPKGLYTTKQEIIFRHLKTGRRQILADLSDIKLVGEHNLQNVLPAIAVAMIKNLSLRVERAALKSFKALKHRLEPVYEKNEVVFVDDSSGTTPEAATVAVRTFASRDTAIILGGIYKGGSLKQLVKSLSDSSVKLIVLIGESQATFARALRRYAPKLPVKRCGKDFGRAIETAYRAVKEKGGVVLLSPACASFDMFKDAYDRGEQFSKMVKQL